MESLAGEAVVRGFTKRRLRESYSVVVSSGWRRQLWRRAVAAAGGGGNNWGLRINLQGMWVKVKAGKKVAAREYYIKKKKFGWRKFHECESQMFLFLLRFWRPRGGKSRKNPAPSKSIGRKATGGRHTESLFLVLKTWQEKKKKTKKTVNQGRKE